MAIAVQTPTGTKWMELNDLLKDDINLNEIQGNSFFDPMSSKIANVRDETDGFDLPDLSEIEEIDFETYEKKKK